MTNNPIRTMRSDMIKKGFERAPHRSLLRATGVIQSEDDWNKPFIAIANSYIDIIPGHAHLNVFGEVVRAAVRAAGGVPFMFNTIGVDDGIAMGHAGMKYSLPSRELIADSVETMIAAHCFDGMICIPNCDKIVPGMLMAAMRLNIPTIFISGGPMMAGVTPSGKVVDLISVFEGVGAYRSGKIDDAGLSELEQFGCPTCGSCSGMFTANSMNCLCEALGMALPGNGTILAVDPSAPLRMNPRREELARAAARQLLNLIDLDLKPRDIVTADAIDNAFALDMAMGGSTNTVLHTLALAHEAGVEYPLARLNEVAERVPNICKVSPSSSYHIEDVDKAGGVSAILWELSKRPGILHTGTKTVTGKTLLENVQGAESLDKACIRPLDEPVQRARRAGDPLRQPGARRRGDQDRGRAAGDVAASRPGGGVRLARRGERGHPERQGQGGRRGGDPLRGAEGRAGDAGDAGAHVEHHGDGAGQLGRAAHRRPVQRRHARRVHRPRLARGRGRRPDRPAPGRRHGHAGHPGAAAGCGPVRR